MLSYKDFKNTKYKTPETQITESTASGGGGLIDALLMMIFGLFNSIGSAITASVNFSACDAMLSSYLDDYRTAGSSSSEKIFTAENVSIKKQEIQETLDQIDAGMEQSAQAHKKAVDALQGKYDDMSRARRGALEKSFKVKEEKIAEAKEKLKTEKDNLEKSAKIKWQGLKTKWETTEEEFKEKLEELTGQWKERMDKKVTQEKRAIDLALATKAVKYGEDMGMPLEDLQASLDKAKEELDKATKAQDDYLKEAGESTEAEVLEALKHAPTLAQLNEAQSEQYVLLAGLKEKYTNAYDSTQPTPDTGGSGPAGPPSENYLIDYAPEFKNVSEGNPGIRQTGPANSTNVESSIEYRSGFTNVLVSAPVLSEAGTGGSGGSGTNNNRSGTNNNRSGSTSTNNNNGNGGTGDANKKKKVVEHDENLNASVVMNLMSKAYEVQPNEKKKDFAKGIVQDIENIKAGEIKIAGLALQVATEFQKNADKIPSKIKAGFLEGGKVREDLKTTVEVSKNLYAKQLENFGKKSRGEEAASESAKLESPKSENVVTYKDYLSQRDTLKSTNESVSVRNPDFITLNKYVEKIKPNLD